MTRTAFAAAAVLTLLLSGAAEAQKPKRRKVAVMDVANLQGVPADTAKILTSIIVDGISRFGEYDVISKADIAAMIGFEKQKQLLGCTDDSSCLAEIGGALGADYLLNGQVGTIGSRYHLSLNLIDVKRATVVTRESRFSERGNEDGLVTATEDAVRVAFAKIGSVGQPAATAEASPTAPKPPSASVSAPSPTPAVPAIAPVASVEEKPAPSMTTTRLIGWIALGAGAAIIAGGVVAGLDAQREYDELATMKKHDVPNYAQEYAERKPGIEDRALLTDVLFGAGAVTAGVGLVMVLVGGNDDAPVALSPSIGSQGLGVAASGHF